MWNSVFLHAEMNKNYILCCYTGVLSCKFAVKNVKILEIMKFNKKNLQKPLALLNEIVYYSNVVERKDSNSCKPILLTRFCMFIIMYIIIKED